MAMDGSQGAYPKGFWPATWIWTLFGTLDCAHVAENDEISRRVDQKAIFIVEWVFSIDQSMTVSALIRMGIQWIDNVRLNRAKRAYRQFLISRIPHPVPLKPVELDTCFHGVGPFQVQQFNRWQFGPHELSLIHI